MYRVSRSFVGKTNKKAQALCVVTALTVRSLALVKPCLGLPLLLSSRFLITLLP